MSHDHGRLAPGGGALNRRLWAAAALNMAITLAELVGGALSGSLALLSDAAHNLSDVVAVLLAIWARRLGSRPPTLRHTYGLKRAEVLAALVNAIVLVGVTVLVAREGLARLLHPQPVAQGIMLGVAVVALAANVASVLLLRRHDEDDVSVRSAFLHMAQDALGAVAVLVAALLAHTPAGPYVDSAAALVVGALVLRSALSLAWETLSTILEGVPRGVDIQELADGVNVEFAPARLHHVHVWSIGPGQRLLTAHVTLGRPMNACTIEALLSRVKSFLRERWDIDHATLEPEVVGCVDLLGRWGSPPLAVSRTSP